jgi:hypothetical protein
VLGGDVHRVVVWLAQLPEDPGQRADYGMHMPVFKSQPFGQSVAASTHMSLVQVATLLPSHCVAFGAQVWHVPLTQWDDEQSENATQALPFAHCEQSLPQSTSVSLPSFMPSEHGSVCICPAPA